jgi:putative ABC transport system permease protein
LSLLIKLLVGSVTLRPARTVLTSMAVVASSCLVVWVVSGYDALLGQSIDENAAKALGRFDLIVSDAGGPPGLSGGGAPGGRTPKAEVSKQRVGGGPRPGVGLPQGLIASLRSDPQVVEVNQTSVSRVSVANPEPDPSATPTQKLLRGDRPPVFGMPPLSPPLIGTDATLPTYELEEGRWLDASAAGRIEGVLSAGYAKALRIEAGNEVRVTSEVGGWPVTVVGILAQPPSGEVPGPGIQAGLFVPLSFPETVNGHAPGIRQINLVLKDGVDVGAYRKALTDRFSAMGLSPAIVDIQALKEMIGRGLSRSGSRALAYSATAIALMAALFIIFTTLSMGVSERIRELAVLRAVALSRAQVAGLVFMEGLLLAVIGWVGGLLAGWGLLAVISQAKPNLLAEGATLGPWCVVLTGVAAFGGALAASAFPSWRATRVSPLDSMSSPRPPAPAQGIGLAALAGLVLLTINPLLTYVLPMGDATRIWGYALVGYPGMVLGFVLLAPWMIVSLERTVGPWLARLLGIPPRLLKSILSANLWRTLGTTMALTVGLGLYVATQTWGYSMLAPFMPGEWVPEMLVGFEPSGLPDEQIEAVKHAVGVRPGRCLPLVVEQPRMARPLSAPGGFLIKQDNVVLIGVDPELAFGGQDPMIDAMFAAGDRATAVAKLKAGRACLVPDHFLASSGMKLGDQLELFPFEDRSGPAVSYEIVGAVSLPGWQWITKMTGLRRRTVRTGGLVFAPFAEVRRDFEIKRINFFWLDTDGSVTASQLEGSMQAIAEAHGEAKFRVPGVGEVTSRRPYARVTSAEGVRAGVGSRADEMIWGMSQIPLVTLLIASLAVLNTIVSSVQARRWDLGILRALGTTRGGIVRLILAESLLIGLVVSVLGMGFGAMAGWCGLGMARYLSPFGGMDTSLVIPWARIAIGLIISVGLCLLAALWPAVTTGRAEPLQLLRSGRGSF